MDDARLGMVALCAFSSQARLADDVRSAAVSVFILRSLRRAPRAQGGAGVLRATSHMVSFGGELSDRDGVFGNMDGTRTSTECCDFTILESLEFVCASPNKLSMSCPRDKSSSRETPPKPSHEHSEPSPEKLQQKEISDNFEARELGGAAVVVAAEMQPKTSPKHSKVPSSLSAPSPK